MVGRNHLNRVRSLFLVALVVLALFLPGVAAADDTVYSFNLWAGVGGAFDQDGASVSNSSYQVGFSVQPEEQLLVGLRLGELDLSDDLLGDSFDMSLDYATVVGEYRFTETFYESGLYIGLGLYSLDGLHSLGDAFSEESIGLVIGISGEFVITDRIGFLGELSGHVTRLDAVDTVIMGHAGFAIHF